MLDDTEPLPFPNDEVTFSLPENEFGALIKQKCKDAILGEDTEGNIIILHQATCESIIKWNG